MEASHVSSLLVIVPSMPDQSDSSDEIERPGGESPPLFPKANSNQLVERPKRSRKKPSEFPEKKGRWRRSWAATRPINKATFVASAVVAFATVAYASIAAWQLLAMQEQLNELKGSGAQTKQIICLYQNQLNALQQQSRDTHALAQTTRDGLVQVQRALMSVQGISFMREAKSAEISNYYFIVHWKNSGTTSTIGLASHHNFATIVGAMPDKFSFADRWEVGEKHKATPSFVGPEASMDIPASQIPAGAIDGIKAHRLTIVLWGWARYRDVFEGTPEHITRYCAEVTGFYGDPSKPGDVVEPVMAMCQSHNCHDEECTGEKTPMAEIPQPVIQPPKPCPAPAQ
jgi:hypothetical protein